MDLAIQEAINAFNKNNVPVGAVIVKNNNIISSAHNQDFWHAEILCIQKAQLILGKFLNDCSLFVTLEPCPMCLYACSLAHINSIVCGASRTDYRKDEKTKKIELIKNIKQEQCSALLKNYFNLKRL